MSFLHSIVATMNGKAPAAAPAAKKPPALSRSSTQPKAPASAPKAPTNPSQRPQGAPSSSTSHPETSLSTTGSFEVVNGAKRRKITTDTSELLLDDEKRAQRLQELREEKAKWEAEKQRLSSLQTQQTFVPEPEDILAKDHEMTELQKCLVDSRETSDAAIAFLRKQEIIAADCEWVTDPETGKHLSLVQVATAHREADKQRCYLFDVITAGAEIFDWGLRDILESKSIIKIFHDCRWDSRVLAQYNCKLARVYDTQVAYCVYCRQTTLNTPFPTGLNTILDKWAFGEKNKYKDIAKSEMEADPKYWIRRPMSLIQLGYAREDVLKLPLVYRQINAALVPSNLKLVESHSENYVNQLRDIKDEAEVEARYAPAADGSRPRPRYGIAQLDDDISRSLDRRAMRESARMSRNLDATVNYFTSLPTPTPKATSVPSYYQKKPLSSKPMLPSLPPPPPPKEPKK